MAVSKIPNETSFSIEVQKGVDKSGDPVFTNKSFSNVRNDADAQNVYDVADAIKGVLDAKSRDTFLHVSAQLANA